MNMVPALVGIYILLIGLGTISAVLSQRLKQRCARAFLKPFHLFVLLSFAYAVMNFIGEVFAPALLARSGEAMVRNYLLIDLVTIPLLAVLFYLLFSFVTRLLGLLVTSALKAIFAAVEVLFLAAFLVSFIAYFARGYARLSVAGIFILNGILAMMLLSGVLLLLFVRLPGSEPGLRRLARGVGIAYAVSGTVIIVSLAIPWAKVMPRPGLAHAVPAGLVFLFNLPALLVLRRHAKACPPGWVEGTAGSNGLAALARDFGVSEREREIARLVALGLGNREIGKRLFISPKTVKNHLTNIYLKTGVRNRIQLANLLNRKEQAPNT